jgi:hypothetical protein
MSWRRALRRKSGAAASFQIASIIARQDAVEVMQQLGRGGNLARFLAVCVLLCSRAACYSRNGLVLLTPLN